MAYHFNISPKPAPRMTGKTKYARTAKGANVRKYLTWKQDIKLQANKMGYKLAEDGVLVIRFYIKVPKCGKDRIGKHHTLKPDIDNLVKAFMDATAVDDDSFVHTVIATKFWCDEAKILVNKFSPAIDDFDFDY
jgi:Holliday junction resolvase RusA-like endonuclease